MEVRKGFFYLTSTQPVITGHSYYGVILFLLHKINEFVEVVEVVEVD